ncbi:MAG: tRNA 2-thiouridine(34) synthase MnmA [archaeon]
MKNRKVILGMSGGVDSSVAALLLQKQGYEVIGFFMNASPSGKPPWPSTIKWEDEEKTLRKICKKLGIELIVKGCEKGYEEKVIKPMFRDYSRGLTPNPDILCNNVGKFPSLLKIAKERGADFIATGHYARVRKGKKGFELLRARDNKKDQSYFLVGLGQKYLSRCLFPIGNLTKGKVREIARRERFDNFDKRSSRGVCYLGKIDMKSFLKQRIKERPGKVYSPDGQVIGSHPGAMFFTIGEKIGEGKGTRIDGRVRNKFGGRWFVAAKTKGNVLVVAPKGHEILKTRNVFVRGLKFVNGEEKGAMRGRIRHLGSLYSGKLIKQKDHASPASGPRGRGRLVAKMAGRERWMFVFNKGVGGVAEGQSLVLYRGERLVGGGEIRLK